MKKLLLLVAAVITSATMNAQVTSAPVEISTAFSHDIIHERLVGETTSVYPTFGDREEIVTDDHGCTYVAQVVVDADANGGGNGLSMDYSNAEFTTEAGHVYKFQDYSQPNAIMIITGKAEMDRTGANQWNPYKTGTGETEKKIDFASTVSATTYDHIGLLIEVMGGPDTREVEITLHSPSGDEMVTKQLANWCKQKPSGADVDPVITMNKRWWEGKTVRDEAGVYIHELPLEISKDVTGVTLKFNGSIEIQDGGFWGYHTFAVFAASAWNASSTGINDLTAEEGDATVKGIYTIDGRQVSEPQHGVNIVKMSNGKAKKVIRK